MTYAESSSKSALRPGSEEAGAGQVFTICVAGSWYGIPIGKVRTIFRANSVTPVPMASETIAGLVNVRGEVVTAIHLSRYLGIGVPAVQSDYLLVGIEHRDESFGFIIEKAGDIVEIDEAEKIHVPQSRAERKMNIQMNTYRAGEHLLPVLDVEEILLAIKSEAKAIQ